MGGAFTAKDFRTWTGTVLAARALQELPRYHTKAEATRNIRRAVEAVSGLLGNTPAVCRTSYIHPAVTDGYLDGTLLRSSLTRVGRNGNGKASDLVKTEAAGVPAAGRVCQAACRLTSSWEFVWQTVVG